MLASRRQLCQDLIALAGTLSATPALPSQSHTYRPPPRPSPGSSGPASIPASPTKSPADQQALTPRNQALLKAEVDHLYALVLDLRQNLALTNNSTVLSVSFVKEAKEIEKLAKQIRDLAKG
jgi:hypothetical protein